MVYIPEGSAIHIGKMGSGKTYAAQKLIKYSYSMFGIADALKRVTEEHFNRRIDKTQDRLFLQNFGELCRTPRESHTVEQVKFFDLIYKESVIQSFMNNNASALFTSLFWWDLLYTNPDFQRAAEKERAVIHDGRFNAETSAAKSLGFTVVKYSCGEDVRIQRLYALYGDFPISRLINSSEMEVDTCPFDINVITG